MQFRVLIQLCITVLTIYTNWYKKFWWAESLLGITSHHFPLLSAEGGSEWRWGRCSIQLVRLPVMTAGDRPRWKSETLDVFNNNVMMIAAHNPSRAQCKSVTATRCRSQMHLSKSLRINCSRSSIGSDRMTAMVSYGSTCMCAKTQQQQGHHGYHQAI